MEMRYVYWYPLLNKQFVFLSPLKKDNKLRKLIAIVKYKNEENEFHKSIQSIFETATNDIKTKEIDIEMS